MAQMVDGSGLFTGADGKQLAEQRLREDIGQGALVPGQRLVEADLSERYHVTRNSARLAIDSLASEGLVERIANRGARVRVISTDEAVTIMQCRRVLDGLLCADAARHATDADRGRLVANLDEMRQAVADGELVRFSQLIQRHHAFVNGCARNATATALVERLQAQIVRHQFQLSLRPRRAAQSLAELDRVVTAIVSGDEDEAERAGRDHLQGVIDALLEEAAEGAEGGTAAV